MGHRRESIHGYQNGVMTSINLGQLEDKIHAKITQCVCVCEIGDRVYKLVFLSLA